MQQIEEAAHALPESVEVPVELLESLDRESHPDLWFKREGLERLQAGQKEVQSKAGALRHFHGLLAEEFGWAPAVPSNQDNVDQDDQEDEEELVVD